MLALPSRAPSLRIAVCQRIRSATVFGLASHPIRPRIALQVYALRHRVLLGDDPFVLSHDGVMRMVSEYAHAAQMAFASTSFNMIGASFGAVLASHVVHTARAIGCHPCRVVLVDPPSAVPRELSLPRLYFLSASLQSSQDALLETKPYSASHAVHLGDPLVGQLVPVALVPRYSSLQPSLSWEHADDRR